MTQVVIDDIIPRTQLTAAASQTVFNTNWTADATTDILVYARASGIPPNDATQLVSSSNYTVTFIGASQTVRVTFLVGRTANDIITIVRNTPAERLNLYINTNFVPSMLNEDFGILTLVDQQAQMYDTTVAPRYNVSAVIVPQTTGGGGDVVLPILPAGYGWRKNDANTAIEPFAIPTGGFAPAAAKYVLQQTNSFLPNSFSLGTLSDGLLKQTVAAGIATPAIAVLDSDYYGPGMVGYMQYPAGIKDGSGNKILRFDTMASAVNFGVIRAGATGRSVHFAAEGTDTNVQVTILAQAAGEVVFATTAPTNAFQFYSGTAYQHSMIFAMPNTAATRSVSWQDADGTVAFLSDIPAGSPSALTRTNDSNVTLTLGGTPATALLQAVSLTLGWTGQLSGTRGGTGVNNGASLLGYEGNISFIGAHSLQVTLSADTSVNFPTGGTLLNSNLTSAHLLVGNGSNIATDVAVSGDASLANTGALTVSSIGGKAVTLAGSLTTVGAFASTFTMTGATNVTFPTSGTLATTSQLVTPAALTKTDDTNVTLTLGGSPSTALVNAASLTLGWTGQLSVARGGTGISSFGTGVATALGVNVGSAGAFVVNGGALGTPSSGTLTSCTGLPIAGITGLGTGVAAALALAVSGSGGIALATSPIFTTPTLGAATATSMTFSSTSGIIGTTTNNNAAAGSVGELQSSVVADSTVSLTLNTNADVTSLVLQPGDYDVWGNVAFNGAAGTGVIINIGWISETSATLPASNLYATQFFSTGGAAVPYSIAPASFCVPSIRVTVATATTKTVYLSVRSAFITSTSTAGGGIYARRRR